MKFECDDRGVVGGEEIIQINQQKHVVIVVVDSSTKIICYFMFVVSIRGELDTPTFPPSLRTRLFEIAGRRT